THLHPTLSWFLQRLPRTHQCSQAPPRPKDMHIQKRANGGQHRGLKHRIVWRPIGELKEFPGNPRRHPESQLAILMKSIKRLWTNPIMIDEVGTILAGHARAEAARRLGMTEVPTITISGLSASEKQAVVIADNRLPELAAWDFDVLRL